MGTRILAFMITSFIISNYSHAFGQMPKPGDHEVADGACASTSYIAEGRVGEDLEQRRSRFFCDSAVLTFYPNNKAHVSITFIQKEASHGPSLVFAGQMEPNGLKLQVQRVYLTPGQPPSTGDGWCELSFQARHLTRIICVGIVDEAGRQTAVAVGFNPDAGQ